jgi:hypothetical protein
MSQRFIDTGIAELLLVDIPEDLHEYYLNEFGLTGRSFESSGSDKYIPTIMIKEAWRYEVLCRFDCLTESIVESLVSKCPTQGNGMGNTWKNYAGDDILITASQGFYSCLHVHGLLTKRPVMPDFSKLPVYVTCNIDTYTPMIQYEKDMKRYIDPKTTLILIKKGKK